MIDQFFSKYLPPHKVTKLSTVFSERPYKAGEKFIRNGSMSDKLGLLVSGLSRSYFHDKESIDRTICFTASGMMLIEPLSYYTQRPSQFTIEFLEPSVVLQTNRAAIEKLLEQDPEINTMARRLTEASYVYLMERLIDRDVLSAKERYVMLMKQRDIFPRIPLKFIASYLGITDTSLSRLRREIRDDQFLP